MAACAEVRENSQVVNLRTSHIEQLITHLCGLLREWVCRSLGAGEVKDRPKKEEGWQGTINTDVGGGGTPWVRGGNSRKVRNFFRGEGGTS